jgi:hypothetical protein
MARAARKEPTVRELDERLAKVETRLDALEGPRLGKIEQRLDHLEQVVKEGFAEQKAVTDLLLKRSFEAERITDQRHDALIARMDSQHAAVMAQFEKLQAKPTEN